MGRMHAVRVVTVDLKPDGYVSHRLTKYSRTGEGSQCAPIILLVCVHDRLCHRLRETGRIF
jgi:hypothetical protein